MEESPVFCVDPEEDEIFFYEITEKEAELKGILGSKSTQLETGVLAGNGTNENNQISDIAGFSLGSGNSENDVKTTMKVEKLSDPNLLVNSSNMSVVVAEKPTVSTGDMNQPKDVTPNENEKNEIRRIVSEEKKQDSDNELLLNKINIQVDHNYSTPVKTVIDKSILKTPKSVVKADKDGGFLKVLSEIALVKAEVDENTDNSIFSDVSCGKEITNDDNKENEKSIQQTIVDTTKSKEPTPTKLIQDSSLSKVEMENENKQFSSDSEMKVSCNDDCQNENNSKESNLENENGKCGNAEDAFNKMELLRSCEENSDELDDIEVIFEKLSPNRKNQIDELKTENPSDISDLIKLDSFIDKPLNEGHERLVESDANEDVQKDFKIKNIPQIFIINETLGSLREPEDDCVLPKNGANLDDERPKKYLRRRTMQLLEELSEIVSHEQVTREPSIGNAALSEGAAKVIQKLKEMEDNFNSSDQYFDLDDLNESFLSNGVSDILNDTLSKPLDLLTTRDVEVLLEKINTTTVEEGFQSQTEILDAEKENLCQNNKQETASRKIQRTPMKIVNSGTFFKTPVSLKSNTLCAQLKNLQRTTPNKKCLSDNKKTNQKPLVQSQTNQNRIRGCQTAEKAVKSNLETRIPKLTSTTSKIPIKGSRDVKMQSRNPSSNKTPYPKSSKSLRFDHIESPVQAYINAKEPILISNVKAKAESRFNIKPKQATKILKPEAETKFARNDLKSNLPCVKYKSAIPLKLEKASESRLPRLDKKMEKLILSNSPAVVKHEGRIVITSSKGSANDTSIALDPVEMSVIVRKVAHKSGANK